MMKHVFSGLKGDGGGSGEPLGKGKLVGGLGGMMEPSWSQIIVLWLDLELSAI